MCTLVIQYRPSHEWPLLLAGNRDEMRDRPAVPPARYWVDRPEVVAGLDELAHGSWMGVNDHGVVAVVMNRIGTLGPQANKRTRGELVLEALDHSEAETAAAALCELDPAAYRPFNLFVGDPRSAYWLRHAGDGPITAHPMVPGLHMLSAGELDDQSQSRIRIFLPRFEKATVPDPAAGTWDDWRNLLASRQYAESDGPHAAMNLDLPNNFGTVSSSLIAVPAYPGFEHKTIWLYADGAPDQAAFAAVSI